MGGRQVIKKPFPRLFNICVKKEGRVWEKWQWVEGVWRWSWSGRRGLFEYEIVLLNDLISLIDRYIPKEGMEDN